MYIYIYDTYPWWSLYFNGIFIMVFSLAWHWDIVYILATSFPAVALCLETSQWGFISPDLQESPARAAISMWSILSHTRLRYCLCQYVNVTLSQTSHGYFGQQTQLFSPWFEHAIPFHLVKHQTMTYFPAQSKTCRSGVSNLIYKGPGWLQVFNPIIIE